MTSTGMPLLSACALALVACNLTPDITTGDTGTSSGAPSIADIQQGVYIDGDDVRLDGVVVTSGITLDGEGFFIQDPGGGEWSGLYIYLAGGSEGLYLAVGDVITITGVVTEFYDLTELTVASPASIEVTGQADVVVDVIDPETVTEWEAWEGTLVQVDDATITGCIEYGEAPISDDLSVDDRFIEFEAEPGGSWTSVIGAISYAYGAWKIYPRTAEDLVGYEAGEGGGSAVSVVDIQSGTAPECGLTLTDVVVTSPATTFDNGFYVADPTATTSEYNGLFVYVGSEGVPSDVVQGATVTLVGSAGDYDGDEDGTPISNFYPDSIEVTGTGALPDPVALTEAPADWGPWEGVLVTLQGAEVTDNDAGYGESATDWSINIDDLFYTPVETTTGASYDVTGIINQYYGYKVAPRSADDLVEQ